MVIGGKLTHMKLDRLLKRERYVSYSLSSIIPESFKTCSYQQTVIIMLNTNHQSTNSFLPLQTPNPRKLFCLALLHDPARWSAGAAGTSDWAGTPSAVDFRQTSSYHKYTRLKNWQVHGLVFQVTPQLVNCITYIVWSKSWEKASLVPRPCTEWENDPGYEARETGNENNTTCKKIVICKCSPYII